MRVAARCTWAKMASPSADRATRQGQVGIVFQEFEGKPARRIRGKDRIMGNLARQIGGKLRQFCLDLFAVMQMKAVGAVGRRGN